MIYWSNTLSVDTYGQSRFFAKEVLKDENYTLNIGEDLIVDTNLKNLKLSLTAKH